MKQESFSDLNYSFRKKKTKREGFLEIIDEIIYRDEWVGVIKPVIRRKSVAVLPWVSRKCCGCICFRSGSICPPRTPRMPYMTVMLCGNLRSLTL